MRRCRPGARGIAASAAARILAPPAGCRYRRAAGRRGAINFLIARDELGEKACRNLVLVAVSTFLVAILTEEGFFRGWLWAAIEKAGQAPGRAWIWSSVAFSLWHLSAVSLKTGFDLPAAQIPVFTAIFGPEVGVFGLALNIAFAAALWRWWEAQGGSAS